MPDLSFLNGPVGASLVTALAIVGTVVLTQWNQRRLEDDKDARALRDARRARVCEVFGSVVETVEAWEVCLEAYQRGESSAPLQESEVALRHLISILRLEREIEVMDCLGELMMTRSTAAFVFRHRAISGEPKDIGKKIQADIDDHEALIHALYKRIQDRLLLLEQPLRRRVVTPRSTLDAEGVLKLTQYPRWWPKWLPKPKNEEIIRERQ